ncbi:MAG: hypothetical protein K6G62_04430 [Eubacterium sp.]|nr:hypothetical protein [Eubacterium sp.]
MLKNKKIILIIALVVVLIIIFGICFISYKMDNSYDIEDSYCVGYDYSMTTYDKEIYWGSFEGIFSCNESNLDEINQFADLLEDVEKVGYYIPASSKRYIFYIKIIDDSYYEFHSYDKANKKDIITYSSVSKATMQHDYLGLNKKEYKGLTKKMDTIENTPSKFFIMNNKIYYQVGSNIYENNPNSIFNHVILKGLDKDASIFVTKDNLIYMTEEMKIYSYDFASGQSKYIMTGMINNLKNVGNTLYIQKADNSIWKSADGQKFELFKKLSGRIAFIDEQYLIYTDKYEKEYIIEEIQSKKEVKRIKTEVDDIDIVVKNDCIYTGQYKEKEKVPQIKKHL